LHIIEKTPYVYFVLAGNLNNNIGVFYIQPFFWFFKPSKLNNDKGLKRIKFLKIKTCSIYMYQEKKEVVFRYAQNYKKAVVPCWIKCFFMWYKTTRFSYSQ